MLSLLIRGCCIKNKITKKKVAYKVKIEGGYVVFVYSLFYKAYDMFFTENFKKANRIIATKKSLWNTKKQRYDIDMSLFN